jgi:hypothetical protein
LTAFYEEIDQKGGSVDGQISVHQSLAIRRELFKLFYDQGEFILNQKADASEALDHILGLIHGWIASQKSAYH